MRIVNLSLTMAYIPDNASVAADIVTSSAFWATRSLHEEGKLKSSHFY